MADWDGNYCVGTLNLLGDIKNPLEFLPLGDADFMARYASLLKPLLRGFTLFRLLLRPHARRWLRGFHFCPHPKPTLHGNLPSRSNGGLPAVHARVACAAG
jgi:hypothetical protein